MTDPRLYWNNRYANGLTSGYGSYGEALDRKLNWLKGLDIKSIAEVGCGDFNFGSNLLKLYPEATYTGYDISEYIVKKNQEKWPQYTFTNDFKLPLADLSLCVDVLYHILDDELYEKTLQALKNGWKKYLALSAYENEEESSGHVKIRAFDPSFFGKPKLREISEDTKPNPLYFYIFEK